MCFDIHLNLMLLEALRCHCSTFYSDVFLLGRYRQHFFTESTNMIQILNHLSPVILRIILAFSCQKSWQLQSFQRINLTAFEGKLHAKIGPHIFLKGKQVTSKKVRGKSKFEEALLTCETFDGIAYQLSAQTIIHKTITRK